jgi:hypothetical protein
MLNLILQNLNSRTVKLAIFLGLISGIEVQAQFFSQFVPPAYRPYLVMVWPVAMISMRNITTTALANK